MRAINAIRRHGFNISLINNRIKLLVEAELLTSAGYSELGNLSLKYMELLSHYSRFLKCLPNIVVATKVCAMKTVFILSENCYSMLIFYFLIISGVEQNPGPGDEKVERKRFRKSGMTYKSYLTNRASFEKAPEKLKNAVENQDSNLIVGLRNQEMAQNVGQLELLQGEQTGTHDLFGCSSLERTATEVYQSLDSDSSEGNSLFSDAEQEDQEFTDSDSESEYLSSHREEENYSLGEDIHNFPIYDGAQITLGESLLSIMNFVKKQNLTGEGFSLLLDLIEIHCKENNLLPKTAFNLKQWFQHLHIKPNKHYYCGQCLMSISDDSDKCPNNKCNLTFSNKNEKCFFVEVSLIEQLRKLYSQDEFRKTIATQFERARQNPGKITDISDGEFFKAACFSRDLCPHDVTFTWNTDGVPLFKSSKSSMWPLFLSVNELPYKMRRNPENLLLVGLWIGPKKPEMMTFLKPFIEDFHRLENGINVDIVNESGDKTPFFFRGFLLAGTADLPAKCTVHNMVQFNGKYSCPYCLQPGETAQAGKGICHIFPFNFEGPTEQKRTHDEAMQFAEIASNTGKPEFGIKGPCWFTQLTAYNFVKSNCIDYMHCVLLGVTKRLVTLWFSKENSRERFCFWNKFDDVNNKILKLKPPLTISRPPRPISELKYWKASEYRSFLLFYGPVVLLNVLSSEYYFHFLLLSEAMFILLKDSIDFRELDRAENLLEHFVATFTGLYKPRYLTLNVHLLLHLPENVRQLGPIWGYSCFPFEDANGFLMNLVKGTQSIHCQLVDSMAIVHGLPYLKKNCVVPASKVDCFLDRMTCNTLKKKTELLKDIFALGKVIELSTEAVSQDCYIALANFLSVPPNGSVSKFKRLKIYGNVIHSKEYTRVRVRNSFTVSYNGDAGNIEYGMINYFVAYTSYSKPSEVVVLAILTKLTEVQNELISHFPYDEMTEEYMMKHFKIFEIANSNSQSKAINVKNILKMCIFMTHRNYAFVCHPPNLVEKE